MVEIRLTLTLLLYLIKLNEILKREEKFILECDRGYINLGNYKRFDTGI